MLVHDLSGHNIDLFVDIDTHDITELTSNHNAYVIRVIKEEEVSVPKEDKDDEQQDPNIEEKQVAAI